MRIVSTIIFFAASLTFAQSSADIQALMASQGSGSSTISASEQQATMRLMEEQRANRGKQDPNGQGIPKSGASDSASLMLSHDSLLAAPLPGEDTLNYRVSVDTVPLAQVDKDPSITQKIGMTADGKSMLVKRKTLIPKTSQYGRFELLFFKNAPASLFGSTTNAINGDYPIKPGDVLVLTIFGEVEKEQTLKVNNQGKVNVEGVGLVSLINMNLGKTEAFLKSKLTKIYSGISSNRTQVNLRMESLSGIKVFVLGEVSKPGGYVFYGNTSLFQALYLAGGPNKIGSVRNIQVTRGDTAFTVDLYEYLMKGKKPEPSVLVDGDIVFLPRAEALAGITGDVGRPAIYEMRKGESAKDLLGFAGKTNVTANHTLSLWSLQPDGRSDVSDQDSPEAILSGTKVVSIKDGDSLVVRASTKTSMEYVDVIGSVWYPGKYGWKAGMTLAQAIPLAGGLKPEGYAERVVVRRLKADSSYAYLADSYSSPKLLLESRDQLMVLNKAQLKTPQMVYVDGAVKHPMAIAWQEGLTAKTLIAMADGFDLNHQKGNIRIERLVPGKDEAQILNFAISDDLKNGAGDEVKLLPGDRVVVPVDPAFYIQEIVSLTGAVRNPGTYSLIHTREGFKAFMDRVAKFDQNAFTQGGRLFRKRGDETYQINFDLNKALSGGEGAEIALQAGDSIFIPKEQLTIRVTGEVVSPGDALWSDGWSIKNYINEAGGYTINGDDDRVIVTYADGRKSTMDNAERDPDPGSVIFVPYKKEPEPTNWATVWTGVTAVVGATSAILLMYLSFTARNSTTP
jgi:protein involved in polysaccharide export with SLBB domain